MAPPPPARHEPDAPHDLELDVDAGADVARGAARPSRERLTLLGEVHDDRITAEVRTGPQEVIVTLDGELDHQVAAVVAELFEAASRGLDRAQRTRAARLDRSRSAVDPTDERPAPPTLFIDAREVAFIDATGLQTLADQRDRWLATRGPCVVLVSDVVQEAWDRRHPGTAPGTDAST
jgi:anti-anti-sigma regulatory factor